MVANWNILRAVKNIGITLLSVGIVLFCIGYFASVSTILTHIGVGAITGAGYIYIMGVFIVITEELTAKQHK